MPEISIIIPVYNVEKYLKVCIDSVLNQTFKDFELILAEDGSTDDSGKICDEFARKDNRIKVIHQKNLGAPTARNNAMDIARGRYIAFVDSDDCIHPQMYEILHTAIVDSNTDIAVCDFAYSEDIIKEYTKIKDYTPIKEYNSTKISNTDMLNMMFDEDTMVYSQVLWNKLFKRNVISTIRMNPDYVIDDFDFVYRVLYNSKDLVEIDQKLYCYFINNNGVMNKKIYNPQKLLVIESWYNMAQVHKNHNNIDMYKKAKSLCSRVVATVFTKCMNGEIEDCKWNEFVRTYLKKCFFSIWTNSRISFLKKCDVTVTVINFGLAKKLYKLKKHIN